jgi:uncharacterized protein (DUF1778 family)
MEGISMENERIRTERLEIRLEPSEKIAFQTCAEISGMPLSTWVREKLRRAARIELEDADQAVPFLKSRI